MLFGKYTVSYISEVTVHCSFHCTTYKLIFHTQCCLNQALDMIFLFKFLHSAIETSGVPSLTASWQTLAVTLCHRRSESQLSIAIGRIEDVTRYNKIFLEEASKLTRAIEMYTHD